MQHEEPDWQSIKTGLGGWFKPEEHKERDLPGGGKWYFIPWQVIRERLDIVCPDWEVDYGEPSYLGDFCQVSCTIKIHDRSRKAIGNAQIALISSSGKDMSRGTPIERAIADAFKNAAEAWGVARYLDEQADPKTKAAFVKYMMSAGDGRPAARYHENEGNVTPRKSASPASKPFGQTVKPKRTAQPLSTATAYAEGLAKLLSCSVYDLDAIAEKYLRKDISELSSDEYRRLRSIAFVEWAAIARQDASLPSIDIKSMWARFCEPLKTSEMSDGDLFSQWSEYSLRGEYAIAN